MQRGTRHERGTTTTEYALVLAGIALATSLAFGLLTGGLQSVWSRALCAVFGECTAQDTAQGPIAPWDDPSPLRRATWGRYVAMGDSYSSGEGAEDFDDESCHVTSKAYGPRLQRRIEARSFDFVACTGARSKHIDNKYDDHNEPAQLNAIDDNTSLVTFTIGGNDLDWGNQIGACLVDQAAFAENDDCKEGTATDSRMDQRIEAVGKRLEDTYRKIRMKAPRARIVAVGYPRFFPTKPTEEFGAVGNLTGLDPTSQRWINEKSKRFNEKIKAVAYRNGVEFVDAYDAFDGHELTKEPSWFHGVDIGIGTTKSDFVQPSTFHPTESGQRRLAELVEDQIRYPRVAVAGS